MKNNVFKVLLKFLAVIFVTLILSIVIIEKFISKDENEIKENLIKITYEAEFLEEFEDDGVKNDLKNGYYKKLSEASKVKVYSEPKKHKYSLRMKGKKAYAIYGVEEIIYPASKESSDNNIDNISKFNYIEVKDGYSVVSFSSSGAEDFLSGDRVEIPSEYNGEPIVAIEKNAFKGNKITGEVFIPSSIKKIGNDAFSENGNKGVSRNIISISGNYGGVWVIDEKGYKWIKKEET